MVKKIFASGVEIATKSELDEVSKIINNLGSTVRVAELDENGNLDWKHILAQNSPEATEAGRGDWFLLPTDKDIGTYENGVFVKTNLDYYNYTYYDYDKDIWYETKPHNIRIINISSMYGIEVKMISFISDGIPNSITNNNITFLFGEIDLDDELPNLYAHQFLTKSDLNNYYTKYEVNNKLKERAGIYRSNGGSFILQGKDVGIYNVAGFGSDTIRIQVTSNSQQIASTSIKDKLIYVVKSFSNTNQLTINDVLAFYFEYDGNNIVRKTLTYDNVYQASRLCQIETENVASYALSSDLSNYLSKTNTTAFTPTANYHPATKKYVDDNKGQITQYSTMPTATENTVDKIVQYTGTTDNNYTNGYFYVGISIPGADSADPVTYGWRNIEVQQVPEGSTLLDLTFISPNKVDNGQQVIVGRTHAQFNNIKAVMDQVAEGKAPEVMVKCNFYRPKFPYDSSSTPVITTSIIPVTSYESASNQQRLTVVIPNTASISNSSYGINRSITTYTIANYDSFLGGYNIQYENNSTRLRPAYLDEVLSTKFTNGVYTPTNDYDPATKKYVDDNAGGSVPIYHLKITGTNFLPGPSPYARYNFDSNDKAALGDIINDAYSNGYTTFVLYMEVGVDTFVSSIVHFNVANFQSKPTYFEVLFYNTIDYFSSGETVKLQIIDVSASLSWSGDICSLGSTYMINVAPGVITTDNTESYTPTGDYNPATKKYVDDTVTIKAYQLAGLTEYDDTDTYNTGDYCYYQNAIYKCNDDNITGSWDSTKWDSKTYLEYLQDAVVGSALGGSY